MDVYRKSRLPMFYFKLGLSFSLLRGLRCKIRRRLNNLFADMSRFIPWITPDRIAVGGPRTRSHND
ncbi:hypothetical protein J6590_043633, partial [Homalodisca vitripennis]